VRKIRQSARTVLRKGWQDPISYDIHNTLKWFLPHEMYLYNLLGFTYDVTNCSTKSCYFYNVFTPVSDIHTHDTRNSNRLFVPNYKINEYAKRCISYSASLKWNELPDELRTAPSLNIFKRKLTKYILSN
jgi:hypothetical protein